MIGWIIRFATTFAVLNVVNHNVTGLHASNIATAVVAVGVAGLVCWVDSRCHRMPLK